MKFSYSQQTKLCFHFQENVQEETQVVSPEAYIKHPLQNKWAMWFFKNDKTKEWTANLKLITTFDTVEDFWA